MFLDLRLRCPRIQLAIQGHLLGRHAQRTCAAGILDGSQMILSSGIVHCGISRRLRSGIGQLVKVAQPVAVQEGISLVNITLEGIKFRLGHSRQVLHALDLRVQLPDLRDLLSDPLPFLLFLLLLLGLRIFLYQPLCLLHNGILADDLL